MNLNDIVYDTVLVIDEPLTEGKGVFGITDKRMRIGGTIPVITPEYKGQAWLLNPYDNYSLGNYVRMGLQLGKEYSTKVFDFGTGIVVYIEHYDIGTCKTSGAYFLIQMLNKGGEGIVRSSSNRYRTISNIGEAISYINSRARALSGRSNYND